MRTVHARQADTVDAICWRELGATTGVVEQVLELNRGLADIGPVLPEGSHVVLPDRSAATSSILTPIQLWD